MPHYDDVLSSAFALIRLQREREASSAPSTSCEGRRGRERRAVLARVAPHELPSRPPRPATATERTKHTRAINRAMTEKLVARAARDNRATPVQAAAILRDFFQGVARELQNGQCVVIPGFCALCPRPTQPKPGRRQRVYVAFSAARNLSVTISEWAKFDENAYEQWEQYRHNHRPSGRAWRRAASTPHAQIESQWKNIGRGPIARAMRPG